MELVRPLPDEDVGILEAEAGPVGGPACKVVILERPVAIEELRASLASRLDRAPELSLRLQKQDGQLWGAREDALDLRAHVVDDEGEPLDREGLRTVIAHLFDQRLERDRPLWR